jgi:hypothetical protein
LAGEVKQVELDLAEAKNSNVQVGAEVTKMESLLKDLQEKEKQLDQ